MKLLEAKQELDDGEVLQHAMAEVAAAIADPSRVSMLCALMDGRAWTATELSAVADIAPSTASAHLNKLLSGQLISCLSQGRHRYYRLAGRGIASLLETLMGVSMARTPQVKTSAPVHLRKARTCYDHLAGEIAVELYAFMTEAGWFIPEKESLSATGITRFAEIGAVLAPRSKRKEACGCLDWSERRMHLGGNAGAAMLKAFEQNGWIERVPGYREVRFTSPGEQALFHFFNVKLK
ncbi:ArsR/SmtB family transcription factor [Kluyvera genomosp. 3]|uniref:Winged helix-turn-helix transcriptional regulator n=1 Tax=Kluyvera genomosp. 3 TaxID=2774055 RepID=A0A6G9RKC3_9ENTR|nr:winged helix-turn-helix domain-containing protein [Kluyvera genomosp. 3]QIR27416.1 winged helix-turn-helix transcriptional regulator [Kluyvera genomosp. 3]